MGASLLISYTSICASRLLPRLVEGRSRFAEQGGRGPVKLYDRDNRTT